MAKIQEKDDKRNRAYDFYMTGQFTQSQIAEIVGRSLRTIQRWIEDGKWDKILESTKSTKEKRIAKYQGYLQSIEKRIETRDEIDRFPTTGEIDQMAKLENIIKKLQDKASIGEIVMFSKNICRHVQAYDVEKSKQVSNIFDDYIKTLG